MNNTLITLNFSKPRATLALLALVALFIAPFTPALADSMNSTSAEWFEKIGTAMGSDQAVIRPLDLETNVIPTAVQVRLATIADDQAQIWGDTILEGDFYAEDEVRLDSVDAILVDAALVGYRITYSSVAFDTSSCEVSMQQSPVASGCLQGRIFESSYVSPQLESWTRDPEAYAEFVADETSLSEL